MTSDSHIPASLNDSRVLADADAGAAPGASAQAAWDGARLQRFRAEWVLPIVSPPIHDGWVLVRQGEVLAVGPWSARDAGLAEVRAAVRDASSGGAATGGTGTEETATAGAATEQAAEVDPARIEEIDLGHVAVMPGLVNAHTHIELSWLWGKVPPDATFVAWVSKLMALRAAAGGDDRAAMVEAVAAAEEAGTAAMGDISNTLASVEAIARSRMHAVLFRELIGFRTTDPAGLVARARAEISTAAHSAPATERIRFALAPHAPYSVAPGLFQAIAQASTEVGGVSSVHLAESPAELQFLREGSGPFRAFLERVGAWTDTWTPPGGTPVDYLQQLGILSPRLLLVHGVQLTDEELRTVAGVGGTIVTCPRSNVWVGSGDPPAARFYASGVRVAIGTDSLASSSDLNVFSELAALHHLAPEVAPSRLLASATRVGATALGFDRLGYIGPGASARLIAIDLPEHVREVETYLVEGIDPGQIAWIPTIG